MPNLFPYHHGNVKVPIKDSGEKHEAEKDWVTEEGKQTKRQEIG